MQIPVHAHLVASPHGLADEVRVAAGDPAQEKERGAMAAPFHRAEQEGHRRLDPRHEAIPAARVGEVVVPADVEPVLDVDRENAGGSAGDPERGHRGNHRAGILEARGFVHSTSNTL